MSFFLFVIFLFLFAVIFGPRILAWLIRRNMQRQAEAFRRAAEEQTRRSSSGYSAPQPRRRKKIDDATGDYIDFEELPPLPDDGAPKRHIVVKAESQVEDVEWEEIS